MLQRGGDADLAQEPFGAELLRRADDAGAQQLDRHLAAELAVARRETPSPCRPGRSRAPPDSDHRAPASESTADRSRGRSELQARHVRRRPPPAHTLDRLSAAALPESDSVAQTSLPAGPGQREHEDPGLRRASSNARHPPSTSSRPRVPEIDAGGIPLALAGASTGVSARPPPSASGRDRGAGPRRAPPATRAGRAQGLEDLLVDLRHEGAGPISERQGPLERAAPAFPEDGRRPAEVGPPEQQDQPVVDDRDAGAKSTDWTPPANPTAMARKMYTASLLSQSVFRKLTAATMPARPNASAVAGQFPRCPTRPPGRMSSVCTRDCRYPCFEAGQGTDPCDRQHEREGRRPWRRPPAERQPRTGLRTAGACPLVSASLNAGGDLGRRLLHPAVDQRRRLGHQFEEAGPVAANSRM